MKRVIMIHGWDGNPENCWFPWLRQSLEAKGIGVVVPAMPDTENPVIDSWVPALADAAGTVDEDTYFVGHSIGCQTIMRFLEKAEGKAGGMVFVAGWFNLPNLETEEEKEIAGPWLETPIDTARVKEKSGPLVAVFSDDDPQVPLSDAKLFEGQLDAKVIVEKGKGHFDDEAEVMELPVVLDELLSMMK